VAHNGSPSQLLMSLYPNHEWEPWKFYVVPRNFWSERSNQTKYLKWLATKLNLDANNLESLYGLNFDQIIANYGTYSVLARALVRY